MRGFAHHARWRRVAKIVLLALVAIVSMPFILVALFGSAGSRRS
ncbi:hypothetical protein [Sphingomonas sp.]